MFKFKAISYFFLVVVTLINQGCDMTDSQIEQELKKLPMGNSPQLQIFLEKNFPNGQKVESSLEILKSNNFEIYQYSYNGYGKWPFENKPYKSLSDRKLAGVNEPNQQSFHAVLIIEDHILGQKKLSIGLSADHGLIVKQRGSVVADAI